MSASGSITVRVSMAIRHRPGRKTVVTPEGQERIATVRTRSDPALVKALGRAFRWKRLLEDGPYASITEMAAAEKIERGYLGTVLQLTLLAPEIVEAIMDGRQAKQIGLPRLLEPMPEIWAEQRLILAVPPD